MYKPRVTITLGRTGQVVERGRSDSDNERARADTMVTRNKRFRGEGIGRGVDGLLSINKRQRGDGTNGSWLDNGVHGLQISPSDLRLKLMHKRLMHKKLLRRAFAEHSMDRRKKMSKFNVPQQWSGPAGSLSYAMPPKERYSFRASREISPHRNFDELCHVPPPRAVNASRPGWLLGHDGTWRPMGSSHLMPRGPPETSKSVRQLTSMRNMGRRNSHVIEEPPTVAGLLQSLHLAKYSVNFQVEEVDMAALKQMGDKDLKDMGIPMGPRKKILARLPRPRQRQP